MAGGAPVERHDRVHRRRREQHRRAGHPACRSCLPGRTARWYGTSRSQLGRVRARRLSDPTARRPPPRPPGAPESHARVRMAAKYRSGLRRGQGVVAAPCGADYISRIRGGSSGRPQCMEEDQAQEGRNRRQARRPIHQADQGNHRRRTPGRRRSRGQRATPRGHRRRARRQHALREHRAGRQEGHGAARRRPVRGSRLRGLRSGRRGHLHRGDDRQRQADRRRHPPSVHPLRRQARHHRLRRRTCSRSAARSTSRPPSTKRTRPSRPRSRPARSTW